MKKSSFTRANRRVGFSTETKKDETEIKVDSPINDNNENNIIKEDEKKEFKTRLSGTKVSLYGAKELISCGHAFIDSTWGGGAGVGQLVLIQEDSNSTYYKILLSLFIAQSLTLPEPQSSLIISPSINSLFPLPKALHQKLTTKENIEKENEKEDPKLIIAWRYENNLKEKESSKIAFSKSSYCDFFDLHKTMELTPEHEKNLYKIDITSLEIDENSNILSHLYLQIKQLVEKFNQERRVLRIVLESFGSSFWSTSENTSKAERDLVRFLISVKLLIRNSTAVCMISLPVRVLSNSFIRSVQHQSDLVSSFESFKGESDEEVGEAFKDYQGHFKVIKLPRIHNLTCYMPDTPAYVFARKRHKFLVEVFSLPPEMTRTTEQNKPSSTLCQPAPNKTSIIDF